jgi:hypothetical protein
VFGIPPVSPAPPSRYATAPTGSGRHREEGAEPKPGDRRAPRRGRSVRRHDAAAILLAWGLALGLSLFVQPHETSAYELVYYTFYNVAAGALVGFYLFDRLPADGFALFALRSAATLLLGTLVNEILVEPFLFGTGPINGVGVYYGLTDSLSWTAIFLLLRLAGRLHMLQPVPSPPATGSGSRPSGAWFKPEDADSDCLFVRVANGTQRIRAADVIYLAAERDFTRIVCAQGEHFVSESLKSLLERSAGLGLIRVHKSYAVNLVRVERLTRTEVRLGDCQVPVGRRFRPAFVRSWHNRPASLDAR